jgi:hypothetical protein
VKKLLIGFLLIAYGILDKISSCGKDSVLEIDIMLLIIQHLKSYLISLVLSFWLVQNLSLLAEGFPTSGNDKNWNRVRYE